MEEADRAFRRVDWAKYEAMSDDELRAARAWDRDTSWPTDEEVEHFDLVIPARSRKKPPEAAAE